MKVIETLQEKADNSGIQIILTTHSPNLASKVKLKNLIICTNDNAFSMGSQYTNLDESDYSFMERFIDVTKSNLFFSE
jgi:SMC domain protein